MKRGASLSGLCGVLTFTTLPPAEARPWRVNQVPNGAVATCQTCHVFPGGPRNAFGTTIEAYGGVGFLLNGDVQWGTRAIAATPGAPLKTLAQIDSDADGHTNGAELLDPLDVWRTGQSQPGDPALVRSPSTRDAAVVIRQLYVGGGLPGAAFQNDFVELFNRSNLAVSIGGWSLQYAPPTGSGNWGSSSATLAVFPAVLSLLPGQSYLVRGASGGTNGAAMAQPDLTSAIAFGDTGGKVALVNDGASLACNGSPTTCTPAALDRIVDLVGYGNANYYEGVAAVSVSLSNSAFGRARNGCTDVNSNGVSAAFPEVPPDFSLVVPVLHGSNSPRSTCGVVAVKVASGITLGCLGLLLLAFGWMLSARSVVANLD